MDEAHRVLKDVFGHSAFKLEQEAVIKRLLVDNENALVLFPTGGGKSLTYQVPALCLGGLTLVISPLIALMKDQVDSLRALGVAAANLDSTLGLELTRMVKNDVVDGKLKMLYVAPERLNNEGFIEMMRQVKISLLAVDESHCISQWGMAFRPEYLKVARFVEEMNVERVLCLTATATPTVAEDICVQFNIDPVAGMFRTPVYRPNLSFKVEVASNYAQKLDRLVPFLQTRTGPAIVYVTLQKQAEQVSEDLKKRGLMATMYHAGMDAPARARVQQEFMESAKGIVCATIAFGMGIDKANIRQVAHLYMPKTLENYSQEVGRAGRDGLESTCLMFLSAPDIPILEGFARGDTCSKDSLTSWIEEVAAREPDEDGTLSFNLYSQGKELDMRANILGLCYAQLELDEHYLRAVTPFYAIYKIVPVDMAKVRNDKSPAAKVIRDNWEFGKTGYTIDMVAAADKSGFPRHEIARQLSTWELQGIVTSTPSQVRNRYRVEKPLPKDPEAIAAIADKLFEGMLKREEEGVRKLKEVIAFATDDDCLAHALASYFGDTDAVPDGQCGKCTFCIMGASVDFVANSNPAPNPSQIQQILQECHIRSDPRLLARMAFGITSPRLTANKWSGRHPLFGSMVDVEFSRLVEAFDAECKKVGYRDQAINVPQPTAQKRPAAGSRSYPSKRGRFG
ncbi:ATP-dependent DNA helicase [Mycena floridula]|nr:ATP-dependent DNA helicase [Mycena floridula]